LWFALQRLKYEFVYGRSVRFELAFDAACLHVRLLTSCASAPVNIYLELASALMFLAPTRNIELLSSAKIVSANANRLSRDCAAARRKGYAIAPMLAPSTMHFAT